MTHPDSKGDPARAAFRARISELLSDCAANPVAPKRMDPTDVEQAAFLCWQGARALTAIGDIAMRDGRDDGPPYDGFSFLKPEDLQCLLDVVASQIDRGYDAILKLVEKECRHD